MKKWVFSIRTVHAVITAVHSTEQRVPTQYSARCNTCSAQQRAACTYTLQCTTHHENVHSNEQHWPCTSNATIYHVQLIIATNIKVKEFRKKPSVFQRVPGGLGSQIS